jgi:four helix bundle protein
VTIISFLDLEVYKESFQLSLEIDEVTKSFPSSEKYLLIDQMIRASRAIPAIIAEGYGRRESAKEFKKYLRDALGEANEMINHLALAKAKKYLNIVKADELISRYNILARKLSKLKDNWQKF